MEAHGTSGAFAVSAAPAPGVSPDRSERIEVLAARFGTNVLATALGYGLNTVLAAVVGVLLARYLGPGEYGLLVSTYAFQSFFVILASVGIDTVAQREVARAPQDTDRILGEAVTLRVLLSLASMVLAWSVAGAVGLRGRELLLVVWVTLAFPFGCASLFLIPYATALRTAIPRGVLGIWSLVLSGLKVAMITWRAPLEAFVALEAGAALMVLLLSGWLGRAAGLRLRPSWAPFAWRTLLRASIPVALTLALIQVYLRVDQVMLYALRGGQETGWYGAAVRIVEVANLAPVVFMSSAFPLLARLDVESPRALERATRMSVRAVAWLGWPFAVWISVEAPRLIPLLFGAGWSEAVPMLRVLAWCAPTTFLNSVLYNRLFATREQGTASLLALAAALLNMGLNLALIPRWGGAGAAAASALSYGVVTLVALGPRGSRAIASMGLRAQLRPALLALGSGVLLWRMRPSLTLGAVLFAGVYAIALGVAGEVGREERSLIRRMTGVDSGA